MTAALMTCASDLPARPATVRAVYLHPGQIYAAAEPTAVTTILGSCVAVCLWDRAAGTGGVSHFQLPSWSGHGPRSTRFAGVAIQELLDRLLALGGYRAQIAAKVFGGACMTPNIAARTEPLGEQNVERALQHLRERSIPISARATGGHRGRKLVFHTAGGTAWLREL